MRKCSDENKQKIFVGVLSLRKYLELRKSRQNLLKSNLSLSHTTFALTIVTHL